MHTAHFTRVYVRSIFITIPMSDFYVKVRRKKTPYSHMSEIYFMFHTFMYEGLQYFGIDGHTEQI